MEPNRAMMSRLFEPLSPTLVDIAAYYTNHSVSSGVTRSAVYVASVFTDGQLHASADPEYKEYQFLNMFEVHVYDCTKPTAYAGGGSIIRYRTAIEMLTEKPGKYFMYKISFHGKINGEIDNSSPLSNGYIGITKRNPFTRFREHQNSARSGTGHILHKTWNGVVRRGLDRDVCMTVLGHYQTLEEAYAAEESHVDEFTLSPMGLNAIPGGMKGIQMMHQLRLLRGTSQISVENRDEALVRLEGRHDRNSPCAHYRTGHFRNLPNGKTTWVSPCWVNPTTIAAA